MDHREGPDEGADLAFRQELLARAHDRLRRLAGSALSRQFPWLGPRLDADSVLHRAWPRLLKALESTGVQTETELLGLAAHKIRQVLIELLREHRRKDHMVLEGPSAVGASEGPSSPADESGDPARLAELTELHEFVGRLPERERVVFEMHYYLELPQSEVARRTGEHPREVSRLWVSAAARIGRRLAGGAPS